MKKNALALLRPSLILFFITTVFFFTAKTWLVKQGFEQQVLLGGNLALFAASLVAFYIYYISLKSGKPQVFVRALYGSFMSRFFIVAITAFVYIMVARENVNKPALVACAVLYILYTFIETKTLIGLVRQKENG